MPAIPNQRNGISTVGGQGVTEARVQRRPAEEERPIGVLAQDRVVGGDDIAPCRSGSVIPIRALAVRWRLVERDDVDAAGAQAVSPVSRPCAYLNDWTECRQHGDRTLVRDDVCVALREVKQRHGFAATVDLVQLLNKSVVRVHTVMVAHRCCPAQTLRYRIRRRR